MQGWIICRSVLVIPTSCGVSGSDAVLCWCEWAAIEASSGCYTAMALLPQSEAGHRLCEQAQQRLRRDARILSAWNDEKIPVEDGWEATLNNDDWLELAGFAFAHRAFSTSVAALTRLLLAVEMPLPALRGKMGKKGDAQLSAELALSGEKRCWQGFAAKRYRRLNVLIIRAVSAEEHGFAMAIFSMTSSVKWHGHSLRRRRIQVIN
jgi:tRNA(Met) C34 N-acetyltransferase TmcA